MDTRIDPYAAAPDAIRALTALEAAVTQLGIEPLLLDLVKLRASQINGCAFCVDLHASDARKKGESERRLAAVVVWRDTPFFTPRERAALAWTELLTRICEAHPSASDYAVLALQFEPAEMVDLSVAIGTINAWNRLSIGFAKQPSPKATR